MDLDALHRNVTKLLKFMERVENQKVMGDQDAPPLNAAQVQELRDQVQGFAQRLEQADLANLNDRLRSMAEQLEGLSDIRQQLAALDAYKTEVVAPALNDVSDMVSWFHDNKANLEGAIMLADAMDEEPGTGGITDPQHGSTSNGPEPTPSAPQGATGESSAAPANQVQLDPNDPQSAS